MQDKLVTSRSDDWLGSGHADEPCGCGGRGCGDPAAQVAQPHATKRSGPAMAIAAQLDLHLLPHGARDKKVFDALEGLGVGESLVIVNDHDPRPLRYQIEAKYTERFVWSYLMAEPELWRVAITHAG